MAPLEGVAELRYARLDLDLRNSYDNTLLFYYVNSRYFTVEGLKNLVANGADIMVQNSSGTSFMHYYAGYVWDWPRRRPPIVRDSEMVYGYSYTFCFILIDLLEFLAAKDFPFSHRNEHGQTVAHLIFEHMCLDTAEAPHVQQLDRILTALNTDIDALDNQGHCVGQYLDRLDHSFLDDNTREQYEALIVKMSRASSLNSGNLMLDFKKLCLSAQSRGQSWPAVVKALDYSYRIDVKGDSPLIAMLKVWDEPRHINDRYRCIEELLQQGVGVDLKDRRGNTAFSDRSSAGISFDRRATPGVRRQSERHQLLNSINSFMAKGWLKITKKMNDDLRYARIASCIPVLQRWQAVFEPSIHRQLLSAKTRAKFAAGELQSSDHP